MEIKKYLPTRKTITNIIIAIVIMTITAIVVDSYTDYKISKAIQTYEKTTTETINFK